MPSHSFRSNLEVPCLLGLAAVLALSPACSGDESSGTAEGAQMGMTVSSQAGSGASDPDDSEPIGSTASSPQGDCPDGYVCTRVVFPENSRVCMKPGEILAPACGPEGACPGLPRAECVDAGPGGLVCTQFCSVTTS